MRETLRLEKNWWKNSLPLENILYGSEQLAEA